MKKIIVLLLCVLSSNFLTANNADVRFLSFLNPYASTNDCPIEIRIEYDFSIVNNDGSLTSHCGMQEITLLPFYVVSFDLKSGINSYSLFILHNATITVTVGGFSYNFIYNEPQQIDCGGNCLGVGSNYCVDLRLVSMTRDHYRYELFYGFILGDSKYK